MKTGTLIFALGLLTGANSLKATSINALENLNLSSSTLEVQIGNAKNRASYSKALRSYLSQSENSCSRSEEIFNQTSDVAERLPGFSKNLWNQSSPKSFTIGEYKIQKVSRPFNAFMLFGHPSFCAKKTCDAKDSLLLDQWTMALPGTSLYVIEKKGKYTGAQIALIPVTEEKNRYTLLVTTDPLKYLQKKTGEQELLTLVINALAFGKSRLEKLALLKQVPGSNRHQVMEMLPSGTEGPELAPVSQFHLNDPMVPNLLSLITKNCLDPEKKGLAKKPKTQSSTPEQAASAQAPGSVNVSVGGATAGKETTPGENKTTTNNSANNKSNSNKSNKTIASNEESLEPSSSSGNLNVPGDQIQSNSNFPSNTIPGLDTYETVNPGFDSQGGSGLQSGTTLGSNSNGPPDTNKNEGLNRNAVRNNSKNLGTGSSGFGNGGPSGILGAGGFLPGRNPSNVGESGGGGTNPGPGISTGEKSSDKGDQSTPEKYSAEDEVLKHKMARAIAELDSKGRVPEHMIMDFANALEASKDPELKALGQKEFHRLYYKNQDDTATFKAMVNLSEKLPLFSDRLERGLVEDMCLFCRDCPFCIGKRKSTQAGGGS